ncbi:Alpha/Beta hydrolase protein [Mycena sp. CBHHK59/15]|nr:Alpha/Beta hydrolase protein [Mycena sp. CBHHK59/15]
MRSLRMVANLLPLPIFALWDVTTTFNSSHNKDRTLKRILGDSIVRYVSTRLTIHQLQSLLGSTLAVYTKWTKKHKLPHNIDELEDGSRLLWLGPKSPTRVVLWFHGGGYFCSATDFSLSFWRYVQVELEKQDIDVGFALLDYSLKPAASFPTPLKQARSALEFMFAAGVHPQNLQIVGDSAGGNLVVENIQLTAPIRGVCLISPWVSLTTESKSYVENGRVDYTTAKVLADMGSQLLADFPEKDRAFAEPAKAPELWFTEVDRTVDRVLITAGASECMRDDIVGFAEGFSQHHPNVELAVQKDGLHEDMFLDFMVKESKVGSCTPFDSNTV